jgi:hypothetical protein
MMSDVHDAFTSLAAHGKELPHGLTEEMKEAVDRLVGCGAFVHRAFYACIMCCVMMMMMMCCVVI